MHVLCVRCYYCINQLMFPISVSWVSEMLFFSFNFGWLVNMYRVVKEFTYPYILMHF